MALRNLSRFNWEEAVGLELHDYQMDFLPSNLYTIAQSKYENIFPQAIYAGEELVGMIAHGEFSGVCWVNRIMIDKKHQEKGIGRIALGLLLDKLRKHPQCSEIRTSFSRRNALAEYFFGSMGFVKLNDGLEDEIVMVFRG